MKKTFLTFLIIIYSISIYAQDFDKQVINVDTMRCKEDTLIRSDLWQYTTTCSYSFRPGFNQIYNTSGQIVVEGIAIKSRRQTKKVGLWVYYKNDYVFAFEYFDKKGNSISKVELYENNKIKSKLFTWDKKTKYMADYFIDGKEVKTGKTN